MAAVLSEFNETRSHVLIVTDTAGFRGTQTDIDIDRMKSDHEACHINPNTLRYAPPGVLNNQILDSASALWTLKGGKVLPGGGTPGCIAPTNLYQMHGFVDTIANSQCSQLMHDSCGASYASPSSYSTAQVYNAANTSYGLAYDMCMNDGVPWYGNLFCGFTSDAEVCRGTANQIVNHMLWDDAENGNEYSWRSRWNYTGGRAINGPVSPQALENSYNATYPGQAYNVQVSPGYYQCEQYSCHAAGQYAP